ncbi:hypothetical protein N7470_003284 [Penicillium chermesinum]|nr:hypothetical protein N7470_003284 [Penicillium chermesinum]
MNAAAQGDKALAESNAPLAIQHYTRALTELPRAPAYYIHRSTAFLRLKPADGGPNLAAALHDAEVAVTLARGHGRRWEESGISAELPIWMMKVRRRLGELPEGDEKATATVQEYPTSVHIPTEKELKAQWEALKSGKSATTDKTTVGAAALVNPASSAASKATEEAKDVTSNKESAPAPPQKVRHEWYQSQDAVVVTLYAKGVAKDSLQTELNADSVSVQFPLPSGAEYDFTLDPLYASIDPTASKVTVMGTKIEIVLQKQSAGLKWKTLEGSVDETKLAERPAVSATPATSSAQGPSYPSSSRTGPKDWDKLADTLTSKKSKTKRDKTKDASDDSDTDSIGSDYGGDATNAFFKKLYADADPDTRRAMMKSFVESEGTSLSTNWSEVGSKKMEAYRSD